MRETITVAEYHRLTKAVPKYGNKRVAFKGVEFDSQAEAVRYKDLLLMQSAGEISGLTRQPSYELQPAFTDRTGKKRRPIRYIADFAYFEQGRMVCEDVKGGKGTRTAVFLLKAKLFAYKFPNVELRIIER